MQIDECQTAWALLPYAFVKVSKKDKYMSEKKVAVCRIRIAAKSFLEPEALS
jgi:hypothetical protein